MAEWDAGYVTGIDYTCGYYPELNPLRHRLALLHAGFAPPGADRACELGFGQGLSLAIHAASAPTHWYGTDFMPSHAEQAVAFATAAGAGNVSVHDEDFARFAARAELPSFDFIGLHGVWSWISDENRAVIVDFIRRRLKVGGVLYLGYNNQPGWAAAVPLRHLLALHTQRLGAPGQPLAHRIDAALEFGEGLLALAPAYASAHPQVPDWLRGLRPESRQYLAHEYFNRDWQPMAFADLAAWFEAAKVSFAASANPKDFLVELGLTPEQRQFLAAIPDRPLRESCRDFLLNRQFRFDYWIRGGRRLDAGEQAESLRQERFVLTRRRQEVPLTLRFGTREAQLDAAVYMPLLDLLADHQPRGLGEIEARLGAGRVPLAKLLEAAMVLVGMGVLAPAHPAGVTAQCQAKAARLNRYLLKRAYEGNEIEHLASPVTGEGIFVARVYQLFLLSRLQGGKTPEDWAALAWERLAAGGERMQKAGKALTTAEENLAELVRLAREFADKSLPILRALKVIADAPSPKAGDQGIVHETSFTPPRWGAAWPP